MVQSVYNPLQETGLSMQYKRYAKNSMNPVLQQLFLEVTPKCNLSCEFCGSKCNTHSITDEVPIEVYRDVLEDVKAQFGTKVFIVLTGGEPLLRRDLFDITAMISEMGFSWGMTSNGTLIGEKEAEKLVETGMYSIAVSIDGLTPEHDAVRGKAGSFDAAVKGVKTLAAVSGEEKRIADIMVTTVFTSKTIHMAEDVWSFIQTLPIDRWRAVSVEPMGSARDSDLLLNGEQMRYLFEFIKAKREEHWPVSYGCCHFLGPDYEGLLRDWYYFCNAGLHVASVMCNGDIGSCLDIERRRETVFGNVYRDTFSDVWRNGFGIYRDGLWKRNPKCMECADALYCRGDSAHSWDFDSDKPLVCIKDLL